MSMQRLGLLVAVVLVAGAAIFVAPKAVRYAQTQSVVREQENVPRPPVEVRSSKATVSSKAPPASAPASSAPSTSLRAEVNLDVPFTSQAPLLSWDPPYDEACEEASVLMVLRYFQGTPIGNAEQADAAIVKLTQDNTELGFPIDDTAEQVATLLTSQDPTLTAKLLFNPTEEDLKEALSAGKLIIVPAAGRQLGNPYFRSPGPRYHMLVLRGYTKNGYVITNDPGTRRGEQYAYRWDVLIDAIHDWNDGDVENGQKVVVVVSQ